MIVRIQMIVVITVIIIVVITIVTISPAVHFFDFGAIDSH